MGNQIHLDLPRRRTNNSMMKLALIGLYCLQATLAATPSKAQAEEWEAWKQEHGKTYPTTSDAKSWLGEFSEEESFRMNIWAENKAAIEKHNREFNEGVHSFHLGMNHFGDLRGHEFASIMNGLRANPENKMNESNFLVSARSLSLPASVDWRKKGVVTHVKDQAQCGSCWAFSATGSLEAAHFRKTGKLVSLSEQQLIDCSGQACAGGFYRHAFAYIKKTGGVDTEKSYPYEHGKVGKCRYNPKHKGARVTGWNQIKRGDENALKQAVATKGPVSVAIDARGAFHQFYQGGVISSPTCSSSNLDHAVLVVGYGKCSKTGKDFWLIKNSWGSSWGEEGYFKLARNENNMCGVATVPFFPRD